MDELARSNGTIYLEAVVMRNNGRVRCAVPPEVVQNGGHGVDFWVHDCLEGGIMLKHESAKQPGAHDMLVRVVVAMLSRKLLCRTDEGGVDDENSANGSSWVAVLGSGAEEGGGLDKERAAGRHKDEPGKLGGKHGNGTSQ
jgi:hypothetical protein